MPNFRTTIANFLFSKIKDNIRINNLPINTHLENEAQARSSIWRQARSSVWREKNDEFASSVHKLIDIIQDRDQEIRLLKSKLSCATTKQQRLEGQSKS